MPITLSTCPGKSYSIPIINGVLLNVQVYPSNVNGFRLYNALISIDIIWDGVNAIDYLSSYNFLNWIWHLTQKVGASWVEVNPSSMNMTVSEDVNGCYVIRQGVLSDGSTFTIKYSLPNDGALKFSLSYTPTKTASYKLWFEVSGLQDGNTNTYINYSKPNAKKVHFVLPSYIGMVLDFDYSDVSASLTQSEQFDLTNFKYNYYVELGNLKAGTLYTVDPTTVSTAVGQYATALGNSRKLFRDAYGKYIAVYKNANVRLGYCNNDPPTSGWVDNDLGATYAVDEGEAFGVAAAYDSTNDRLMVGWVGSLNLKVAQITFTRDASNNITGYTAGSVLSIAPAYVNTHNPSLWMLHNGEVAAVWADEKSAGAKHSVVKFCRVVFGSPPTYKNAAGTASSVNTISADWTTQFIIRIPTIVERTNSGTGQYDMYCFHDSPAAGEDFMKVKATWSSPNWSWGTPSTIKTDNGYPFTDYDSLNGKIVFGIIPSSIGVTYIDIYTIDSSDTQTDISVTGLSIGVLRDFGSMAINQANGDYYLFLTYSSNIYYLKRSGGSWGSETQFTTTANENYPSCKVDGAGNKIELIWTHYTGSAYNVYYDNLPLIVYVYNTVSSVSKLFSSTSMYMTNKFNILFSTFRSIISKYNILLGIAKTSSILYQIVALTIINSLLILKFKLSGIVSNILSSIFKLQSLVYSKISSLFLLKGLTFRISSLSYNLKNLVSKILSLLSNIRSISFKILSSISSVKTKIERFFINLYSLSAGLQTISKSISSIFNYAAVSVYRILGVVHRLGKSIVSDFTSNLDKFYIVDLVSRVIKGIHSLLERVSRPLTPLYSLRENISKAFRSLYNLKIFISKIVSSLYSLKNLIIQTSSSLYRIRVNLNQTLKSLYNIKILSSRLLTSLYSIRNIITNLFRSLYNIITIGIVNRLFLIQHNLSGLTTRLMSLIYNLRSTITNRITSLFNIRNLISKGLSLVWKNLSQAIRSFSIKWNLRVQIARIINMLHSLLTRLFKTVSLKYLIRTLISRSMYILHSIIGIASRIFTSVYNLGLIAFKTLSSKYSIRSIVSKSISGVYNIVLAIFRSFRNIYTSRILGERYLVFKYSITGFIYKLISSIYSTRSIVLRYTRGIYNLLSSVMKKINVVYLGRTLVQKLSILKYNLQGFIYAILRTSYGIKSFISSILTGIYNQLTELTKYISLKYNLKVSISKIFRSVYSMIGIIQKVFSFLHSIGGVIYLEIVLALTIINTKLNLIRPKNIGSLIRSKNIGSLIRPRNIGSLIREKARSIKEKIVKKRKTI
jgi:hypothetical protein